MSRTPLILALLVACGRPANVAAQPLQKADRIVFVGDSITVDGTTEAGFQSLLKAWVEPRQPNLGITMRSAGVSGDRVTDVQARFDKDVLAHKPTVVVIAIGINDVWRGKDGTLKDRYQAGLVDLAERCRGAGARVVFCTPTVIGERKSGANPFDKSLDDYAQIVRAVAKDSKASVCDLRSAFVEHLKLHNAKDEPENVLTRDGVHLNDAGNRLVALSLAKMWNVQPLLAQVKKLDKTPALQPQPAGPKWFFRDGERLYWNGSSHSQDEGWQCSLVEFYLRTRFPQWKITSGRGGPTSPSATAFEPIMEKLKPTVVFCEFGYYGGDDQIDGVVKEAERLAVSCQAKNVRLVMMPSAFRAAHIDRLPAEYKGLNKQQIAELNAVKQKDGTLNKLGQDIPAEVFEKYYRMRGAPGCDKRVEAMRSWGTKYGIFVPRSYEDQRDWLFKIWETDPKFPWGGGHPPTAGYVAVGYFLLERMEAPIVESRLVLDVGAGQPAVQQAVQCEASELKGDKSGVRFKRFDKVLPVIPPLPVDKLPREPCPVLKYSPYFLTVQGLAEGTYDIVVESAVLGQATHQELARGVNLNEVYIRTQAKKAPNVPWLKLWLHCRSKDIDKDDAMPLLAAEQAGRAAWLWEIRRAAAK